MQPDPADFETDFEKLAGRFAAQSGGGLSPELSSDLALQIVLNEIVEEACLETGATGAAIVLPRDGEMICRASSGSTAPDLGSRLDTSAGLSGECFNTRRTQRCDDVLEDPRVDLEASSRLGVRSLMVLPLLNGPEFAGILEVFSSRPAAFGDRDQLTLDALGQRILSNLERAAKPLPVRLQDIEARPGEDLGDLPAETAQRSPFVPLSDVPPPGRAIRVTTWVLGLVVLMGGAWMGVRVFQHLGWSRIPVHARAAQVAVRDSNISSANSDAVLEPAHGQSASVVSGTGKSIAVNAAGVRVPPPAGGLSVYENGREVFRMRSATPLQSTVNETAASVEPDRVIEVPPTAAEAILLKRVEPDYPEAARERQIQGPVVVDVRIGKDGAVQGIKVVSGDPLLTQASEAAVKQWRFKPYVVDGRAVEMQTRVTLNFSLPR